VPIPVQALQDERLDVMAFIRWKEGSVCLVENRRVDGRVRQKTLLYLGRGTSVEDAARNAESNLRENQDELDRLLRAIQRRGDVTVEDAAWHDRLLDNLRKVTARVEAFRAYGPPRNQREKVRTDAVAEPAAVPDTIAEAEAAAALDPSAPAALLPPIEHACDQDDRRRRAAAPLAALGQEGGHGPAWVAARLLIQRSGLTPEEAFPLLAEWNRRCQSPLGDFDLRWKLAYVARWSPFGVG
jgi:hypothetical protein